MAAPESVPASTSVRSRPVVALCAVAAVCAVAIAGCAPSETAPHGTQANPNPGGVAIFNNRSVDDLVAAIQRSGLPAPNPRDVTARDCPQTGCTEKVDTDTVAIMKFPTTGKAELYAGSTHHCFQIADVVVAFGPMVSPSQQRQYERVVTSEIQ
jgi:hypothetical protein